MAPDAPILELRDISKEYESNRVLKSVSLLRMLRTLLARPSGCFATSDVA